MAARGQAGLEKVAKQCHALGGKVEHRLFAAPRPLNQSVQAHIVAGDLGSQAHAQVLVDTAVQAMGGIDVLLLNHVVGYWDNWLQENTTSMEQTLQHYFRINTFGFVHGTQP